MNNPRFLIAKYAPDIHRMEPRNIGLFLWNNGHIRTKFLDVKDAEFIHDTRVYRDWVTYWNDLVDSDTFELPGRSVVPKASEECLNEILSTQDGNYIISDAGFVPADIPVIEMPNAVDFLFNELIARDAAREVVRHGTTVKESLHSTCDLLLSPLSSDARFHRDVVITNNTEDDLFPPKFTYGFGDPNKPEVLLQVVSLKKEDQVRSAAQKFQAVTEDSRLIDKSRCGCLIDSRKGGEAIQKRVSFLFRYGDIIDVGNPDNARKILAKMGLPILAT